LIYPDLSTELFPPPSWKTTGWTDARGGIAAFLPVSVLAIIIIGAGYYLLVMRKKK
jgi:hypothetical protein